jgi:hypothetical protein
MPANVFSRGPWYFIFAVISFFGFIVSGYKAPGSTVYIPPVQSFVIYLTIKHIISHFSCADLPRSVVTSLIWSGVFLTDTCYSYQAVFFFIASPLSKVFERLL